MIHLTNIVFVVDVIRGLLEVKENKLNELIWRIKFLLNLTALFRAIYEPRGLIPPSF